MKTYTKQSFSEARRKRLPNAFTLLHDGVIQTFYGECEYKTYKGFRLLAVDGSVIELPNKKEMKTKYGYISTSKKEEGFQVARALPSHLYDLENRLVMSTCLSRYDDNERDLTKQNIEKLLSFHEQDIRDLIRFDRGYPSADLLLYLQEKGISYVMRASKMFFKEAVHTTTRDEIVTIVKSIQNVLGNKGTQGKTIPVGTRLKVRVIKVELSTGETEILLTNLQESELSYEESKPLYFKRWGLETRFDHVKYFPQRYILHRIEAERTKKKVA